MELCEASAELLQDSQELRHLAAVPLAGDHFGQPLPSNLPHDDEVEALGAARTDAAEDSDGEGEDGVGHRGRVVARDLQKVLRLCEDILVNAVASHQFQDKLLLATTFRVAEEPDTLVQAAAETLHFLDRRMAAYTKLGDQLRQQRRVRRVERPRPDLQLAHLETATAAPSTRVRGSLPHGSKAPPATVRWRRAGLPAPTLHARAHEQRGRRPQRGRRGAGRRLPRRRGPLPRGGGPSGVGLLDDRARGRDAAASRDDHGASGKLLDPRAVRRRHRHEPRLRDSPRPWLAPRALRQPGGPSGGLLRGGVAPALGGQNEATLRPRATRHGGGAARTGAAACRATAGHV
mmetsp:Transcript_27027/g.76324  ORF Transcript_27027/g.76324 Transcript_27027/m.76324 type:complete len:347 (+) Transcript_27027:472-1512(+)